MASSAGERIVCRVDRRDDHVVVRTRGILTVDTTAALAEALRQGLSHGHVIIDLQGVTEVDASAYRELEKWQRRYRDRGEFLVLAAPSPQVHRLMRVLHLDHVISVFPNVSAAEEAVKQPVRAERPDQAAVEPVRFAFPGSSAPGAERLAVVGSFNGWDPQAHPMAKTVTGDWTLLVHLPPGRYLYHIWVDGVPWLDPHDDGREPNAWGTEYSIRYIGRRVLADRVLKPIQGGAQVALECHKERTANAVIVRARGEIDLSTIPILETALRDPLENGQHLIVDLTAVRYIDSTGLHTLLKSEEQLREKRLQVLVVVPPSAVIHRVFQISAIDKVIRLFPTLDEAVHSLRPDP
jgi:anti-sigma B factor antagonist